MARDFYGPFDHPVLRDLPEEPPCDFLTEMDGIADDLRAHPPQHCAIWGDGSSGSSADEVREKTDHIEGDDQIAFRQLQRLRLPKLSQNQCLDLFAEWQEHYAARQATKVEADSARLTELMARREALFAERAALPEHERAEIDARLAVIGAELAKLITPADMLSLISHG